MIQTYKLSFAVGLLFSVIATPVAHAQDEAHLKERERLLAVIAKVESDAAAHAEAIRRGEERISFCANCHGKDGNSIRPDIPKLAGQNPAYMLEQFDNFAEGRRQNLVMQTLAREFTMEDKVNISVYFSNQPVQLDEPPDPALAAHGAHLFQTVCQFCHGADGRGEQGYARLAGQRREYVINTLKRYRTNAHSEPDPTQIKRTDPRMEQVTQALSDRDIEALAHYIAALSS